jgi:hypothetical protein
MTDPQYACVNWLWQIEGPGWPEITAGTIRTCPCGKSWKLVTYNWRAPLWPRAIHPARSGGLWKRVRTPR